MRKAFLFLFYPMLFACATIPGPHPLYINKVSIVNHAALPLTNVRLDVANSGGVVSCGYIAVDSECSAGFPRLEYQGNPVTVSWQQSGSAYRSELAVVQPGEGLQSGDEVDAVVAVLPAGEIRIYFARQP
jgi:hypothetical protein